MSDVRTIESSHVRAKSVALQNALHRTHRLETRPRYESIAKHKSVLPLDPGRDPPHARAPTGRLRSTHMRRESHTVTCASAAAVFWPKGKKEKTRDTESCSQIISLSLPPPSLPLSSQRERENERTFSFESFAKRWRESARKVFCSSLAGEPLFPRVVAAPPTVCGFSSDDDLRQLCERAACARRSGAESCLAEGAEALETSRGLRGHGLRRERADLPLCGRVLGLEYERAPLAVSRSPRRLRHSEKLRVSPAQERERHDRGRKTLPRRPPPSLSRECAWRRERERDRERQRESERRVGVSLGGGVGARAQKRDAFVSRANQQNMRFPPGGRTTWALASCCAWRSAS